MNWLIKYVCVFFCALCASCANTYPNGTTASKMTTGTETKDQVNEKRREEVTHVKTALRKAEPSDWKLNEVRTIGHEDLRAVYFLDEMHGWVGGKDALYSTTDGGKTWLHINVNLSKTAFVTKIVFPNLTEGWIVAQEEASDPLVYHDNHFWLMRTSDGGQTWSIQVESKDSVINQIKFVSEREAWFIGIKYTGLAPLRGQDFVFHTLDGGEHWLDVSEQLNQMITALPIKPGFTDILPEGLLRASILLPTGNIFRTDDGGRSWQPQNATIDDFTYACSCHIGVTDTHHLWVGGWKDDRKSILGMVAVKEGDSWKEYLLEGVSFLDILFLSRDRILTCGSTTPNQHGYTEKRQAVLSYSSDGGTTWSFIYQNPKAKKISTLVALDSDHVWAVGDDGLVLRLWFSAKDSKNVAAN